MLNFLAEYPEIKDVGWLIWTSMVPVIELRGAIPIAAGMNFNPILAYFICTISNMIPVPFIMFFGKHIFMWLKKTRLLGKFAANYENRLMKKAEKIMGYAIVGLITFVAIPLPGTGAWSGAVVAILLNMRMKYAIPAIGAGVLIAGVIVSIISYGVAGVVKII